MVGVNISHLYFHPGGAHITWVKIISHTGKSKALTVTLKKNLTNIELPLSFNNTTLETIDKHKHLGVELSTNLS